MVDASFLTSVHNFAIETLVNALDEIDDKVISMCCAEHNDSALFTISISSYVSAYIIENRK